MTGLHVGAGRVAFEDVHTGLELPPISLDVTYKRICMNAAAAGSG